MEMRHSSKTEEMKIEDVEEMLDRVQIYTTLWTKSEEPLSTNFNYKKRGILVAGGDLELVASMTNATQIRSLDQ